MNKILTGIKDYLFNKEEPTHYQLFNYVTVVVITVIIKIFLILMGTEDTFVSQFEICVWAFMMIWLVLRMAHSMMLLKGYYALASIFCLLYILIPVTSALLINISVGIVIICKAIEIIILVKEAFANVALGEGVKE